MAAVVVAGTAVVVVNVVAAMFAACGDTEGCGTHGDGSCGTWIDALNRAAVGIVSGHTRGTEDGDQEDCGEFEEVVFHAAAWMEFSGRIFMEISGCQH